MADLRQRTDDGRDDLFLTCEIRTVDGQSLGILVLKEKVFRSSKTGFFGQAKLEVEDQRYQAQAQLVAIAAKVTENLTEWVAENGIDLLMISVNLMRFRRIGHKWLQIHGNPIQKTARAK